MKDKKNTIIDGEHAAQSLVPRHKRSLAEKGGEWLMEPNAEDSTERGLQKAGGKEEYYSDDIYKSFARQIARIKRLSEEEEYALGMLVQEKNDDNA